MNKRIYFNQSVIDFSGDVPQKTHYQSIRNISEQPLKNVTEELLRDLDEKRSGCCYRASPDQFNDVFESLKKDLLYIEAAGGLIRKEEKYLFIYRFEKWDLPKGKLDKGETVEQAAVRECEEECGVRDLIIERQLPSTFHVYRYKSGFALKQTYWFYMSTGFDKKLLPQTEENITDVRWFTQEQAMREVMANSYFTIQDVVNHFFSGS